MREAKLFLFLQLLSLALGTPLGKNVIDYVEPFSFDDFEESFVLPPQSSVPGFLVGAPARNDLLQGRSVDVFSEDVPLQEKGEIFDGMPYPMIINGVPEGSYVSLRMAPFPEDSLDKADVYNSMGDSSYGYYEDKPFFSNPSVRLPQDVNADGPEMFDHSVDASNSFYQFLRDPTDKLFSPSLLEPEAINPSFTVTTFHEPPLTVPEISDYPPDEQEVLETSPDDTEIPNNVLRMPENLELPIKIPDYGLNYEQPAIYLNSANHAMPNELLKSADPTQKYEYKLLKYGMPAAVLTRSEPYIREDVAPINLELEPPSNPFMPQIYMDLQPPTVPFAIK